MDGMEGNGLEAEFAQRQLQTFKDVKKKIEEREAGAAKCRREERTG